MIYLDHCATTRPYSEVVTAVSTATAADFWNPSSMYRPAKALDRRRQAALQSLASLLGCQAEELIQTSCATESTNMALKGLFARYGKRLDRIICCASDHDATLATCDYLATHGADIIRLKPRADGRIDPADLVDALNDRTLLVSILHVNNETGVVQDLETLVPLIREHAPKAFIHGDLVQSWGRIRFSLRRLDLDLASFSAHKIHGPKGVGLLYRKAKVLPDPLIHGGGQQKGWRSGTDNWPLLHGMQIAAEIQAESFVQRKAKVNAHRAYLSKELTKLGAVFNFTDTVAEICSVSFPGLRGETILHMLEEEEIYLSTASACQTGSGKVSHVLQACGVPLDRAQGTLRISLDALNTEAELEYLVQTLKAKLEQLRQWQS